MDLDYAASVVELLEQVGGFTDLSNPSIAEVVRNAVARYAADPTAEFECIVDNPGLANWRLRPGRNEPGRVRLACYRYQETQADVERVRRVDAALEQIRRS
ncbi:hypothetical protein [Amycolatopsis sp. TNS106]|uniref:hypothetical protein n=1 Tax=Amycolatopsis sp. TNS106 TaxID=2861750 RepID=UPI001C5878C7|nr:hypothetical protein [Amycolatopsis sp. TNS106]QXV57369.1 hypothetical protein CVV72_10325 [Amycolatopsis sp. TNS106]